MKLYSKVKELGIQNIKLKIPYLPDLLPLMTLLQISLWIVMELATIYIPITIYLYNEITFGTWNMAERNTGICINILEDSIGRHHCCRR